MSLTKIIFNTIIYYILIPAFMLNYLQFNVVEASLIKIFINPLEIILFNSLLGLLFMTCLKVFQRGGDIGIMMAVGGRRHSCIFLILLEVTIILSISFLIGSILQYNFRIIKFELQDFIQMALLCFLFSWIFCLIFTIFITYIFTLTDPYNTIRKKR